MPALAELMQPWRPACELNIEGYPDERLLAIVREVRPELGEVLRWCASQRVPCQEVSTGELDRIAEGAHHEGLCVATRLRKWLSTSELADTLGLSVVHVNRVLQQLRRELADAKSGRQVIVGLRPENFEDAALVPAQDRDRGLTFRASIDVLESMGSDVFVYFTGGRDATVSVAELDELAKDSGQAETGGSGDTVVARLSAATRVREGSEAELWADARAIHVFDPANGRNLSLGSADEAVPGGKSAPAAP